MNITKLERKPGVWRIRVERKDTLKNRHFEYYSVRGNTEIADAFIEKLRMGKSHAEISYPKNFAQYFENWLRYRIADQQIRPSSAHSYRLFLVTCMDWIGKIHLQDITKDMLNDLYRTMLKTKSPAYVKMISIIVKRALKDALSDGLIEKDPTVGVKTLNAKRELKTTTFSQDQLKHLLEAARECEKLGPIIRFALATGMRRGEICALQVKDVNLEQSSILVRRNCTFYDGVYHLGKTKTKKSNRTISLPEELKTEISLRIKNRKADDFVFTNSEGQMFRPSVLTTNIRRFLDRIGLGEFSIHDLRHAHATYLLQQRMHVKAVSERLGHSDIRITLGIYTHVLPGDDEVLAQSINQLF